jgi:hypothetical protein
MSTTILSYRHYKLRVDTILRDFRGVCGREHTTA